MAVYKITKPPRHTPGKLEIEYRPNQFLDIRYESGQEQTKAKAFCEALLAKQGHYELYIEL